MNETIGTQNQDMIAKRDNYWEELTDKQKIERMRTEVKGYQRQIEGMLREIAAMRRHSHLGNGDVYVPLSEIDPHRSQLSNYDRSKYF